MFDFYNNLNNSRLPPIQKTYIFLKHSIVTVKSALGPLHMSPVDRDSPVTEISLDSYFLCKIFDVFIPVTEISVVETEISVTGMKIFPYEHFIPVTGMKKNSNTITHFRDRTDNS